MSQKYGLINSLGGKQNLEEHEEQISGRNHAFKVVLPHRLAIHSDNDLRLMLVSLKNVRIASEIHIFRIEGELKRRGCHPSI